MKTQEQLYLQEITRFKTKEQFWNPYPWYKEMRENSPVFYDEQQDTWNVFLYKDAKQVAGDYQLFSSARDRSLIPVPLQDNKVNLIFADPPDHRKRRGLLAKAFTPRSLETWKPRIQNLVHELIERVAAGKAVDIVEELAVPLPVTVIAKLLGVPTGDWKQIKEWSDILFMSHDYNRIEELNRLKEQAGREFSEYLYPIVMEKRLNLEDDLLSDLIQAEYEGAFFNDTEIVQTVMGLLGAGNETTTTLITNMFYCLAEDQPDAYGQLRKDPGLVPQTVEEVLRYRFNIALDRRIASDTDVFGPLMRKDQLIIAWVSSANRDESQFPNGEIFDIHREGAGKHLTFGSGNHFCLGAPLARMEAVYALEAFVKRFARYRLADDFIPKDHLGPNSHELKSLSIVVEE
ncbi:cytochrome P450 [Paenibacillus lutrae]|uniref:Cytochrome P450 n=1 Tax=Paenibacillus lutrae TaxID=2078573 RepID=A0A7X3FMP8_9BACL|nr:cytochrome P450 [Paenibacillus lutrae]MVP02548.1 cytochrome P450 [Paenibacillus lutrae]